MRESIPRQVDKESRGPQGERGLEFSRRKRLLISWLQSPSAVILEPRKIKSDTVSPSISHEVVGPDAKIGRAHV